MRPDEFSVTGLTLGQYQIGERIGAGGMATVYRGLQTSLNRDVAIKVLPAYFANDQSFVGRFKQEAQSVASLRHPNILSVFDFGEQNGIIYMVTEYVPGGTLANRLGTPRSLDETLMLMTPLAAELDYAHSRGIIHRDLKPANVLMTLSGEPILSDFGLARLLEGSVRISRTGSTLGTPEYMSPEQAMALDVGPQTDVYAFGVLLFEMLTGSVPFPGDTPVAIILAHLHQPPPSPRSLNPKIPEQVEAIVLRCLAKKPQDRYPSASEVLRAIESTRPYRRDDRHRSGRGVRPSTPPQPMPQHQEPLRNIDALQTIEYAEMRVDLRSEKLLWNGRGMEQARELLRQRLRELRFQGWELAGSLHDPGVIEKARTMSGPMIKEAVLLLRRVRA